MLIFFLFQEDETEEGDPGDQGVEWAGESCSGCQGCSGRRHDEWWWTSRLCLVSWWLQLIQSSSISWLQMLNYSSISWTLSQLCLVITNSRTSQSHSESTTSDRLLSSELITFEVSLNQRQVTSFSQLSARQPKLLIWWNIVNNFAGSEIQSCHQFPVQISIFWRILCEWEVNDDVRQLFEWRKNFW